MDEMSVRLDDGTDLGEDQKKKNLGLGQPKIIFIFFCIDQNYLFFLLTTIRPD
jgi:hypothetical protein